MRGVQDEKPKALAFSAHTGIAQFRAPMCAMQAGMRMEVRTDKKNEEVVDYRVYCEKHAAVLDRAAKVVEQRGSSNKKIRRIHLGMTTWEKKRATRKIKTSITMTEEKRAKKRKQQERRQ